MTRQYHVPESEQDIIGNKIVFYINCLWLDFLKILDIVFKKYPYPWFCFMTEMSMMSGCIAINWYIISWRATLCAMLYLGFNPILCNVTLIFGFNGQRLQMLCGSLTSHLVIYDLHGAQFVPLRSSKYWLYPLIWEQKNDDAVACSIGRQPGAVFRIPSVTFIASHRNRSRGISYNILYRT